MRQLFLSVIDHPACAGKADVFLDGALVDRCVAGHEGEGWVDVDAGMDMLVRQKGRVEFRPKPGVTRADLEQIADQQDMVHLAGVGFDGAVYVSGERLVCHEAMALVRRLNALLPDVQVWVSAPEAVA
jgi:hypothetical protein